MAGDDEQPRWLTDEESAAWQAMVMMVFLLPGPLDTQLQRDSGLTLFEYLVLSQLSMSPGQAARMSELARLANGSLTRLSNVARRFEERGLIERSPDPTDGRYTIARLTPAGRAVVVDAAPGHVAAVRTAIIDRLTTSQLRSLTEIGRRLLADERC